MQLQTKKTAILFILFTANNIMYSLTDLKGTVILWTSTGSLKSSGLKKTVSSLVHTSAVHLVYQIQQKNFSFLHVKMKGLSKSKRLIVKTFQQFDLKILSLQDLTSFPHNGCRRRKKRSI